MQPSQSNFEHRYKQKADKKTQQALEIIERLRMKKEKKRTIEQQTTMMKKIEGNYYGTKDQKMGENGKELQKTSEICEAISQLYSFATGSSAAPSNQLPLEQLAQIRQRFSQLLMESQDLKRQTFQLKQINNFNQNKMQHMMAEMQELRRQQGDQPGKGWQAQCLKQEIRIMKLETEALKNQIRRREEESHHHKNCLKQQIAHYNQQISNLTNQLQKQKYHVSDLEKQTAHLRQTIQVFGTLQNGYKQEINGLKEQLDKQKKKTSLLEAEINNKNDNIIGNELQVKETKILQNTQLKHQLIEMEEKNKNLLKQLSRLDIETKQSIQEKQAIIKQLQQKISSLLQNIGSLENQMVKYDDDMRQMSMALAEKEQFSKMLKCENDHIMEETKYLRNQLANIQRQLSFMQSLKNELDVMRGNFRAQEDKHQILEKNHQQLKDSHQLLNESYQQQVKANQSLAEKNQDLKKRIERVQKQREQQLEAFEITIKNVQQGMNEQRNEYEQQIATMRSTMKALQKELQQLKLSEQMRKPSGQRESISKQDPLQKAQAMISQMQEKNDSLSDELTKTQQELKAIKRRMESLNEQNKKLELRVQILSNNQNESLEKNCLLQKQLLNQQQKYAQSSSNIYKQIESLNLQVKKLSQEKEELLQIRKRMGDQNQQLNKLISDLDAQKSHYRDQVSELERRLAMEIQEKAHAVKSFEEIKYRMMEAQAKAKAEDHIIGVQQDKSHIQLRQLNEKINQRDAKIAYLNAKNEQMERVLIQMDDLNANLKKEIEESNRMREHLLSELKLKDQASQLLIQKIEELQKDIKISNQQLQKSKILSVNANGHNTDGSKINQEAIKMYQTKISQLQQQLEFKNVANDQLKAQLEVNKSHISQLQKELQALKSGCSNKNASQSLTIKSDNRHIKTIEHLTIELQNAYSQINQLKQSLMKKSQVKMNDSLLNDSSMLEQSFRQQKEQQQQSVKPSLNLKVPPKPERVNTLIDQTKTNTNKEKLQKTQLGKQSSKEKQKRSNSIKKITNYFGF